MASRAADTRALLVPLLSVAPYVLMIFWLLGDLGIVRAHPLAATAVAVVYLALLSLRVLGAAFGVRAPRRRAARAAAGGGVALGRSGY